jgi:hexosaminidase
MKKQMCSLIAVLSALSGGFFGRSAAAEADLPVALVPQPAEVERGTGQFLLRPDTPIVVDRDSAGALGAGKQLAERIRGSTGWDLKVAQSGGAEKQAAAIRITAHPADPSLWPEGYALEVSPQGVVIAGGDAAGMFYGTQTLLQLLPPRVFSPTKVRDAGSWAVPAVRIRDRPRFHWRGMLLDVARHFFSKDEVKNFLDLMAQHKLNTLQLHLTDDQGWRIEIKRYEKLSEIAAWRKSIGFGLDPHASTAYAKDGRYGGYFTQDDIRELVAYAQARFITIVPEIEMPGHAAAALSVYPQFSCSGGPYDRDSGHMGIYCPGNDAAFQFLENILGEVIGLFPGKYVHIGGDEVERINWMKCPKCKARMQQEHLANFGELQSYFVKRIERFVNAQGRTLIGWDEILEGGLSPNATVMCWRDARFGMAAAAAGHDVVMTPTSHCYLDYYQAKTGEPRAIGGFLPLRLVYEFEPLPPGLSADKARHILGGGGTLWSEFFPNYAQVQYMTFPRACAIAEATWSEPKRRDWTDFRRRLETHLERLAAEGVHYRAPKKTDPGYEGESK